MVYALLGGKVLHASGYLIGTGYQVLGGELLCCIVADIVTVLQVRRPLGLQVLLYVVFGGIFHESVQRTVLCAGPSRLMVSLCCPIIFIISISEIRFDRSFSVASDFNIFTDTLVKWLDLSLSSPMASSNTTCPK